MYADGYDLAKLRDWLGTCDLMSFIHVDNKLDTDRETALDRLTSFAESKVYARVNQHIITF